MALDINTTIDAVEIREKTGQHGPFNILAIKANGIEYTKIMKRGEVLEVAAGDEINLKFSEGKGKMGGTFYTILSLERLKGGSTSQKTSNTTVDTSNDTSPFKSDAGFKAVSKATSRASQSTTAPVSFVTTKDISMEVSGLLQALISTGHFTGQDGISNTALAGALRLVLRLKRDVAAELEQNGTV
jgi:hypothetical protein